MNLQPIEKAVDNISILDVHSIFYTIQGEGPFQGRPAVFIRLAGCNLQCPLCDTDYTSKRELLRVEEVSQRALGLFPQGPLSDKPIVVITGGEPFRQAQALEKLVGYLFTRVVVQIETNGTLEIPGSIGNRAHIVVSPKTAKVHPTAQEYAVAFKYVAQGGDLAADGLPIHALGLAMDRKSVVARRSNPRTPIYLQPADEKDPEKNAYNNHTVIASCMTHGYRLQAQIHKFFDLE